MKTSSLILLIAACFYILGNINVFIKEKKIKKHLYLFDLNKNDNFELNEQTPEMKAAMKNVIADTGRTFTPFTLIPYSLIIASIGYFSFKGLKKLYLLLMSSIYNK